MNVYNKLNWYLNRLNSMSFAEISYRLRQRIVFEKDRIVWKSGKYQFVESVPSNLFEQFNIKHALSLMKNSDGEDVYLKGVINRQFFDGLKASLEQADKLCQSEFTLFEHRFQLEDQIDWRYDPLTGRCWPHTFSGNIDTRDGRSIGGVKWVWELNRHHHFVTLGKAYFLTNNERYANALCAQLENWIECNPPFCGVNWTSSLELAIRLINWAWALNFIRNSAVLTPVLFARVMQSVAAQATYISRHLSAFSSANNHLIGEAAGLAFTGLAFRALPGAAKWREAGFAILEREISLQINSDGTPAEQSPDYLKFILNLNLHVWRLADLNGLHVPSIWYERFEKACEFLLHLMDDKGRVPTFGDSDDAEVVRLNDQLHANDYRSLLGTAAVFYNRLDFKQASGKWDEKNHWLFGKGGAIQYEAINGEAKSVKSRHFSVGGYSVFRVPGRALMFDCGPLGYLSTAAHGHADALSLTLNYEAMPLLVDPGTYAYQEGGEWREFFRSTAAHNTVVLDRLNQSEIKGDFLWGRKANSQLRYWQSTSEFDAVVANHDGYSHLGIVHTRSILFYKPNWLLVVDDLNGSSTHLVEQFWHLSAGSIADILDGCVKITNNDFMWQLTSINDVSNIRCHLLHGEINPIQGWVSSHYGHKEPAPVVCYSTHAKLPLRLMTMLSLEQNVDTEAQKAWQEKLIYHFQSLPEEEFLN